MAKKVKLSWKEEGDFRAATRAFLEFREPNVEEAISFLLEGYGGRSLKFRTALGQWLASAIHVPCADFDLVWKSIHQRKMQETKRPSIMADIIHRDAMDRMRRNASE